MKDKVYLAVTVDKYELPLAIFENYKEISDFNGRSIESNQSAVTRGSVDRKNHCKYIKVYLSEEDDIDKF